MRRRPPSAASFATSAAFDTAVRCSATTSVTEKTALQLGLVPAREGLAGVRGFELRDGDDMFVAGFVRERRPVEASELVVEHAGEAVVQDPGAHLERLVDREPGPLGLRFERHGGRPAWPSSGRFEPRLVDLELVGIEHDLVDGVDHLDGDALVRR